MNPIWGPLILEYRLNVKTATSKWEYLHKNYRDRFRICSWLAFEIKEDIVLTDSTWSCTGLKTSSLRYNPQSRCLVRHTAGADGPYQWKSGRPAGRGRTVVVKRGMQPMDPITTEMTSPDVATWVLITTVLQSDGDVHDDDPISWFSDEIRLQPCCLTSLIARKLVGLLFGSFSSSEETFLFNPPHNEIVALMPLPVPGRTLDIIPLTGAVDSGVAGRSYTCEFAFTGHQWIGRA